VITDLPEQLIAQAEFLLFRGVEPNEANVRRAGRYKADYDIEEPFQPLDAAVDVAQARLAFVTWAEVRDEPIAQRYLYSLLFKDRS